MLPIDLLTTKGGLFITKEMTIYCSLDRMTSYIAAKKIGSGSEGKMIIPFYNAHRILAEP